MNHPDAGHTTRETGTTMHYTGIRGGTIAFFPGPAGIRVLAAGSRYGTPS